MPGFFSGTKPLYSQLFSASGANKFYFFYGEGLQEIEKRLKFASLSNKGVRVTSKVR